MQTGTRKAHRQIHCRPSHPTRSLVDRKTCGSPQPFLIRLHPPLRPRATDQHQQHPEPHSRIMRTSQPTARMFQIRPAQRTRIPQNPASHRRRNSVLTLTHSKQTKIMKKYITTILGLTSILTSLSANAVIFRTSDETCPQGSSITFSRDSTGVVVKCDNNMKLDIRCPETTFIDNTGKIICVGKRLDVQYQTPDHNRQ